MIPSPMRSLFAAVLVLITGCSSPEHPAATDAIADGDRLLDAGDAAGAVEAFTRAIALAPDSAYVWFRRGEAKHLLGDEAGSATDLSEAIRLNLKDAMAWYKRGNARKAQGDFAGAADDYTHALEIRTRPEFHRARGHAWFGLGDWKRAVADLTEAVIGQAPGTGLDYTRLELCLARIRAGERDAGVAEMKRYFRQSRPTMESAWARNLAAFLEGELPEEDLLLTASSSEGEVKRSRTCEVSFYAGVMRIVNNDPAGAKPLLEKCIENRLPGYIEPDLAAAELKRLESK